MRLALRLGLVLLLLCPVQPLAGQGKPFKRALVLTGGGFKFLYFVGMYDALMDSGWVPDVIISTCGASVAMAIIHGEPDRGRRLELIQSAAMLEGIRGFRLERGGFRDIERLLRHISRYRTAWETGNDVLPDLHSLAFYDDDPPNLPGWGRPFTDRAPGAPHLLILGATADLSPDEVGKPRAGRKVYHEAFFTDPEVAAHLTGLSSSIAQRFPGSAVGGPTRVFTDVPVGDAALISIRDPFLFKPVRRGDTWFTGANINLYPLELARHLADEVMMTFNTGFNDFELLAIRVSLGYDMNARLREVTAAPVDRWIDATLAGVKRFAMDPRMHYGFPTLFELRPTLPRDEQIGAEWPYVVSAEAEFTRRALAAYDWGYTRAWEAAHMVPTGSTAHVRGRTRRNFGGDAPPP